MLVTCTFYGLRHSRAKVAFQVEREDLVVGEVFAFAGEHYVILSVVEGDGTYAANVAPEQSARARMLPRARPPSPGLSGGPAKDRKPPSEAETGHARLEACEAQLQCLLQARADELTRLGQLLQQFEHLQPGNTTGDRSVTGETSIAAGDAGDVAGFPELLQALEEQRQRTAAQLARLQTENRRLEADAQAGHERLAALEAEVHELRRRGDVIPASTNRSGPLGTPAQALPEAHMIARLTTRLAQEPGDIQARVKLATLCARHGLDEDAIREYQQVLMRQPECVEALEPLALLLEKLNRAREAAALWEHLLGVRGAHDPAPSGGPDRMALGSKGQETVNLPPRHPRTPWCVTLFTRLLASSPRTAR
jgi:hypothetical protein